MDARTELYIGGAWVRPSSTDTISVENPYTEQIIATVPAGSASDVDAAVSAARTAFEPWAALEPAERSAHLERLHAPLQKRAQVPSQRARLRSGSARGLLPGVRPQRRRVEVRDRL